MVYYLIIECFFLLALIYFVIYLVFIKNQMDYEMISAYECGFDPNSSTRVSFSYRFFLISILFIIFDVEISLMLSVPFLIESYTGMYVFYLFIFILILGLIYEYYWGSLDWLDHYVFKA